jgi:hypothetical protein
MDDFPALQHQPPLCCRASFFDNFFATFWQRFGVASPLPHNTRSTNALTWPFYHYNLTKRPK